MLLIMLSAGIYGQDSISITGMEEGEKPAVGSLILNQGNRYEFQGKRINRKGLCNIALTKNDPKLNGLVERSKINKGAYIGSMVLMPFVAMGGSFKAINEIGGSKGVVTACVLMVGAAGINISIYSIGKKIKRKIAARYNALQ